MSFYAFGVRMAGDADQPRLEGLRVVKCVEGAPNGEFLEADLVDGSRDGEYLLSGAVTATLRGDRAWIAAQAFCAAGPVVLLCSGRERDMLDRVVEDFGYAPLTADRAILIRDLARIAAPRLAVRDGREPAAAPEFACELWRRLAALPQATIHALLDGLPSQAWQALLTSAESAAQGGAAEADGVKVVGGLAFRPAPAQQTGSRSPAVGRDAPTGRRLARESVSALKAVFAQGDEPFEVRPGQNEMIRTVSETLTASRVLAVEAGTGTGKSLAYLLPAAIYARQSGRKIVVATHTTALQEQLRRKEWPAVQKVVEGATAVVMKGRNHYVCLRKAADFTHAARMLDAAERDFYLAAAVWLTETETGDAAEFAMGVRDRGYWQRIQSETETCIHRKCPFFRDCHYFRAKARAAAADIVVTNHSLVISDLVTEHRVLPAYQYLIIDEAHHFEGQATAHLGADVTWEALRRMIARMMYPKGGVVLSLRRHLERLRDSGAAGLAVCEQLLEQCAFSMREAEKEIDELFAVLSRFVRAEGADMSQDSADIRLTSMLAAGPPYGDVLRSATQVAARQRALADIAAQYGRSGAELDEATEGRCEDVFGRVAEFAAALGVCADVTLQRREADGFVSWMSARGGEQGLRLSLHLAPLSVAEILKTTLFARKEAVVLASATLSVGGRFEPALEPLGLSGPPLSAQALRVNSPFDYRRQVKFFVPTDMPEVRDAAFTGMVSAAVERIARATQGRAMILFTANQMMREVAAGARARLAQSDIRLLVQGEGEHRKHHLIDQFRSETRAVLFGVSSFWEGIDIRGDDLSCLVIVKLPFPVPTHPLVEARSEMLRAAGKSPFSHFSLPRAVIRFTQGFGRLVRTQSDRGVVFVLDKRLVSARYGRTFLASLPEVDVVSATLEESCARASAFFR